MCTKIIFDALVIILVLYLLHSMFKTKYGYTMVDMPLKSEVQQASIQSIEKAVEEKLKKQGEVSIHYEPKSGIDPLFEVRLIYSDPDDVTGYMDTFRYITNNFKDWPIIISEQKLPMGDGLFAHCNPKDCRPLIVKLSESHKIIDIYTGDPIYTYMERWFRKPKVTTVCGIY